jgi:urease accessory protein
VDLEWHECLGRALRTTSKRGRLVRILFPPGVTLRHGDVLGENDGPAAEMIVINVLPCEVLVLRPRDAREAMCLALELGNLHARTQIVDGALLVLPDGPVEALVWQSGVPHELQVRRFAPEPLLSAPAFRSAPGDVLVRRTSA